MNYRVKQRFIYSAAEKSPAWKERPEANARTDVLQLVKIHVNYVK